MLAELPDLDWRPFSVVAKGRPFFPIPFPLVRVNHFASIQRLFLEARKRGYRRIGIATVQHGKMDHPDDHERHGAALDCMHSIPACDRVPVYFGSASDKALRDWFFDVRPDAVVTFFPHLHGVLCEAGVRIPEEVGFASLLLESGKPRHTGLTGFLHDRPLEFKMAINELDRLIHRGIVGPQADPRELCFSLPWIEGRTLPGR